ncbi:uncharacterized protein N0V89_011272 [Didymosphaeria variabile]|uniref:Uncharacterized protein n=1 Tax=Didymosphaeria variabile TaxID=1932322 RepID=A0A9W9C6X9_9PLEO|nr:uncharacterized protein N0V89_011272 [Didymosphaeria variabile]KAJ4347331.1 hypothetical protein N0V89_011272 [Didymosphaeria variabile]
MLLLTLILALIGLAVALPATNLSTAESWPAWACSDPNFHGFCDRIYADQKCVNLPEQLNGKVSSMMQWTGYACDYYSDDDCQFIHSKMRGDFHGETINGVAIKWFQDMGPFDDKMKSAYCKAYVDGANTASIPSVEEGWPHGETLTADLIQTPGAVTVFSKPNFAGDKTYVNAFAKCSRTFGWGTINSLKQEQGAVCRYYQSKGCFISNAVPVLRHDSTTAAWDAADLGAWALRIQSFRCDLVAP